MGLNAHDWECLFTQWHEAKSAHVGFMQRAHLCAISNPSQSTGFLAAASIAMADMQAAHRHMLALVSSELLAR